MAQRKPKKGRVIRINPDLVSIIEAEREGEEPVSETLRRLLGLKGDVKYVLPSDIHETVEDARGRAILKALRSRRPERPIPVRPLK